MFKKVLFTLIMAFEVLSADVRLPSGPNHWQSAPKLVEASVINGKTLVKGRLKSVKNTRFAIQFFTNNDSASLPCKEEGPIFLGQVIVHTDHEGKARFKAVVPASVVGSRITATATRLAHGQLTDTSEFSEPIRVH